jgi:hypothetical protein
LIGLASQIGSTEEGASPATPSQMAVTVHDALPASMRVTALQSAIAFWRDRPMAQSIHQFIFTANP